jgi:hypothetical protein
MPNLFGTKLRLTANTAQRFVLAGVLKAIGKSFGSVKHFSRDSIWGASLGTTANLMLIG